MPLSAKLKYITERQKKMISSIRDSFFKLSSQKRVIFIKEFENILHKFQPIISYVRFLESYRPLQINSPETIDLKKASNSVVNMVSNSDLESPPKLQEGKPNQRYALDMPKLFEGLKDKLSTKKPKETTPKWKTKRPTITLESINSRTTHVLASVRSAGSIPSRLKRLEDLTAHLSRYPQAKPHAVKEGAVQFLLSIRRNTKDEITLQVLREAFAMLGHIDPPMSSGIRILSIDGGGMRGIAVIKMLQKLEQITGRRIYELFDYVCGVSTGAIITCCMVPPLAMNMESLYQLYKDLSAKVFQQSALWGTSKLMWSHAYYDTSLWEKLLNSCVGTTTLLETTRFFHSPKVCAVSTIVNHSRVTPFLFRNYSVPYLRKSEYQGSSRHTIFEAIRASAAAPTIFEEFRIGELLHQDGGILVNNPTAVAVHEVKALWPDDPISCVVSCGTGRYNPVLTINDTEESSTVASSWKRIFDKILDSATDTEAVHTMLNDLLPEDVYHRLNPHLTEFVSMDEIREGKLATLENETEMYCRRNEDKFKEVAKKLLSPRSTTQKCQDFVKNRIKLFGY